MVSVALWSLQVRLSCLNLWWDAYLLAVVVFEWDLNFAGSMTTLLGKFYLYAFVSLQSVKLFVIIVPSNCKFGKLPVPSNFFLVYS